MLQENTRKSKNGQKDYQDYPVHEWKIKISVIKGHDVLLTIDKKIPTDNSENTKVEGIFESKLFNKTSYNELILAQEGTDFFRSFNHNIQRLIST